VTTRPRHRSGGRRDLLEELLQAKEAEIGSPSPEIQEWAAEIFREAEALAANEPSAEAGKGDKSPKWHAHKAS
jgi:hypothetical protein